MAARKATLVQEFKRGCETYREQALNGRLATAEEIAKQWPGGEYNPGKTLKQWAGCYGWLKGLCVQIKARQEKREQDQAAKRAAVLDAIAEMPETVELVGRGADGNPQTLTVYQKSDVALRVMHGVNMVLASLIDDYSAISKHATQDDVELLKRALDEQGYLQRVLVWIATSDGSRLPFPEGQLRPAIPDTLSTLHPLDFYSIAQAFQRVNVAGFAALESSTTPTSRPDWSVFWSGMANETGVAAARLMRDRGLLSLVAEASELARARAEAEKRHSKGAA